MTRSLSTSSAKESKTTIINIGILQTFIVLCEQLNANSNLNTVMIMALPQLWYLTLTLLDAEAGGPLLQGNVVVAVSVALLEEAGGAVLHGNEGSAQGRELGVGEEPGHGWDETKTPGRLVS